MLDYFLHDTGKPSRGRWNYCLLVSWMTRRRITQEHSVERIRYFLIHPSPFVQYPLNPRTVNFRSNDRFSIYSYAHTHCCRATGTSRKDNLKAGHS